MGAQVSHEIKKDSTEAGVVYVVAQGIPVAEGAAPPGSLASQDTMGQPVPIVVAQGEPIAGAPESEEMER